MLDQCGNLIGHVSTTSLVDDSEEGAAESPGTPGPAMIIFHKAVGAADVLRLIEPEL